MTGLENLNKKSRLRHSVDIKEKEAIKKEQKERNGQFNDWAWRRDRMIKQETVNCFLCSNEVWIDDCTFTMCCYGYSIDNYHWNKKYKGWYLKLFKRREHNYNLPVCSFCRFKRDVRHDNEQLRIKKRDSDIEICERMSLPRIVIDEYPELINLKRTQLNIHRKFKNLKHDNYPKNKRRS